MVICSACVRLRLAESLLYSITVGLLFICDVFLMLIFHPKLSILFRSGTACVFK